jgi:hypothetical protein
VQVLLTFPTLHSTLEPLPLRKQRNYTRR